MRHLHSLKWPNQYWMTVIITDPDALGMPLQYVASFGHVINASNHASVEPGWHVQVYHGRKTATTPDYSGTLPLTSFFELPKRIKAIFNEMVPTLTDLWHIRQEELVGAADP